MLRIEHLLGRLEAMPEQLATELASTRHEHDQALHALEVTSFPRQAELDELRVRARQIAEELASDAREVPPGDVPAPPAQGSAAAPATQASAPVSIQWRQLPLVLARHHGLGIEPSAFFALARRIPVPQMLRTWEQWQRLGRQVRAGAPVVCEGAEGAPIDLADTDGSLLVPNSTCSAPSLDGPIEALQRLTPDLSLDGEPGDIHGLLQVLEALGALPNDSTIGQLATQIAAHSAAIWLGVDPGVVHLPDDFPLEHEQLFSRTVERALEKLEHVRSQITVRHLAFSGAGCTETPRPPHPHQLHLEPGDRYHLCLVPKWGSGGAGEGCAVPWSAPRRSALFWHSLPTTGSFAKGRCKPPLCFGFRSTVVVPWLAARWWPHRLTSSTSSERSTIMNSIQIIGRLTKDPELTTTTGGHSLCRMRVAIPRPSDTEDPVFIDVVSWDRLAHSCEAHLSQGRQVAVCGRLDYSEWSDGEGAKHSRHDIVATSVDFLSQPKAKDPEAG